MMIINNGTQQFLEELKNRPDVLGIILFGSWARGNNRPDSDVDLVVILKDGFKRTVEYKDKQAFEIIYTTEKSAFQFWESQRDDAAGLWEVAKILYDKDGTIERLKKKTEDMLKVGKKPCDEYQLGQLRFDAEDQLKYVERIANSDPTTANFILSTKVFALTELYFDIRQKWTPAPKQRLSKIKDIDLNLYLALEQFYKVGTEMEERIQIAKNIVTMVFGS